MLEKKIDLKIVAIKSSGLIWGAHLICCVYYGREETTSLLCLFRAKRRKSSGIQIHE